MLLGAVFIISLSVSAIRSDKDMPDNKNIGNTADKYNVYSVSIPETLSFAEEDVPVNDPDIRERLDRELLVNTYWQSNTLLLIKRAKKYFPIIEPILKEHGVPDDFKYLAIAESGLQNVISPANATGYWQFMRETAREYGLEVNSNVDERYHLKKSTEAACKYLKDAKERFGSWTLTAAAYNAGQYGVDKRLNKQSAESYYDLLLGEETGRYVFRILAFKEIISSPEKYGFNVDEAHLYSSVPTYEVEVDTAVSDFTAFSEGFNISYKVLKIHNPWLRESFLNNKSRRKYQIEIPKDGYYQVGK